MNTPKAKIEAGVYRIGAFVVIREDVPSLGEFDEAPRDVTWGVVSGEFYDRMEGDVGLPDSINDFKTLAEAHAWIEAQQT